MNTLVTRMSVGIWLFSEAALLEECNREWKPTERKKRWFPRGKVVQVEFVALGDEGGEDVKRIFW